MSIIYIAEIGNNHNGSIQLAKDMIDAAIISGADYVKFQIYSIDKFIDKDNPFYDEFFRESLSFEMFRELKFYTESKGGKFLATPFDEESLLFLHRLGLNIIKIASGDMNNRQLLLQAVGLNKKLIISVGGAEIEEIDRTVELLNTHNAVYTLLHCTINYPAQFEELNLNFLTVLKNRYQRPIGYSDHSLGIEASLAAISLGAVIIEKHFTIDRGLPGGDNVMSVLPEEFNDLRIMGNHIFSALGSSDRLLSYNEQIIKKIIRRKFVTKRAISKGEILTSADIILLRVKSIEGGFGADSIDALIGKKVIKDLLKNTMITIDVLV